jgi:hypothetical protein
LVAPRNMNFCGRSTHLLPLCPTCCHYRNRGCAMSIEIVRNQSHSRGSYVERKSASNSALKPFVLAISSLPELPYPVGYLGLGSGVSGRECVFDPVDPRGVAAGIADDDDIESSAQPRQISSLLQQQARSSHQRRLLHRHSRSGYGPPRSRARCRQAERRYRARRSGSGNFSGGCVRPAPAGTQRPRSRPAAPRSASM